MAEWSCGVKLLRNKGKIVVTGESKLCDMHFGKAQLVFKIDRIMKPFFIPSVSYPSETADLEHFPLGRN